MTTEAHYYDIINTGLIDLLGGRFTPIKLEQNTQFPAMFYSTDVDGDGYLELSSKPAYTFEFSNTFYAHSYAEITQITDKIIQVCADNDWNISGYADNGYDENLKTYSRTVNVTVVSTL